MGKKNNKKDREDLEVDGAVSDDEGSGLSDDNDGTAESGARKKEGTGKGLWTGKWRVWGPLVFILLAGIIAGIFFRQDLMKIIKGKKPAVTQLDLSDENLQEEVIAPFFIPPSADLKRSGVRIDMTVIWDGVASVHYKTDELRVRDKVYEYLKKASEEMPDLNARKTELAEAVTLIFRESLVSTKLSVRIKELKLL